MSLTLILIASILATYRLASLISREDGPWDVFKGLRTFFGRRAKGGNFHWFMAELLNCVYCSGVWVALIFSLVFYPGKLIHFFLLWIAVSGGQAFMQKVIDGLEDKG